MSHPYASAAYAAVFGRTTEPLWVPAWKTHVLVRPIPGSADRDAVGVYPLTVFGPGRDLASGLAWLKAHDLVSVGLTVDPLTAPAREALTDAFALCVPFKPHFVVDYEQDVRFTKHHRYEVRRALSQVEVREVELAAVMDDWTILYATLTERRAVGGFAQLERADFERLSGVEGLRSVAALVQGRIVSMHLWVEHPGTSTVQSLLAASNAEGYACSAPYAVYDASIRLFSHRRRLNLGGAAGMAAQADDGLARFKRGFANAVVDSSFCAAVLDEARYAALSGGTRPLGVPFPAYRARPPEASA